MEFGRLWRYGPAGWVIVSALYANPLAAESLDAELGTLLQNHPQIQSKSKAISSATEGVRAARAGYLPTAKLSGDSGQEWIDNADRKFTYGDPWYKPRQNGGLTITQRLWDASATDSAVESAKITKGISESDLRATRQSVLLEGAGSYIDVVRQTKLIALSRDNEHKVQEQLKLEDERVQKGSGIASDVLAAKQRLQVAKERRVNFEGQFYIASAKYTQVFGHAPDAAALVDPPLPVDILPRSLDDALDVADKENPTIETALKTVSLNSEKRSLAEAGYYPTLDLVTKGDMQKDYNGTAGIRRDWSVVLQANWELFSGFKTDAQVSQATWDYQSSKDNQSYTARKVAEQVRTAWHKLTTAKERLGLLENAANIAEEVWRAQQKKREAGKATVQDVLDEETRINEARINYTSAFYDMIQASYDLLAAMGRLEVDAIMRVPAKGPAPAPSVVPSGPAAEPPPPAAQDKLREGRVTPAEPPPPTAAVREKVTPVSTAPVTSRQSPDGLPDGPLR